MLELLYMCFCGVIASISGGTGSAKKGNQCGRITSHLRRFYAPALANYGIQAKVSYMRLYGARLPRSRHALKSTSALHPGTTAPKSTHQHLKNETCLGQKSENSEAKLPKLPKWFFQFKNQGRGVQNILQYFLSNHKNLRFNTREHKKSAKTCTRMQ